MDTRGVQQHDFTGPPRVAVVNDYELVIAGLEAMLEPYSDRITVGPGMAVDQQPDLGCPVDVALYDSFGSEGLPLGALKELLSRGDVRRLAIYTVDVVDDVVNLALKAGATGILSKATPAAQLVDQIERVAAGELVINPPAVPGDATGEARDWPGKHAGLSERESEIVALVSLGRRNSEIASALFISVETVKTHLSHAFRKLGVSNRTQVASFVLRDDTFRRARAY